MSRARDMPSDFDLHSPTPDRVLAERLRYARAVRGVVFSRVDRTQRFFCLSRLAPEQAREAWRRIQSEQPALASLLTEPLFQALRETFDAEVLIDECPAAGANAAALPTVAVRGA